MYTHIYLHIYLCMHTHIHVCVWGVFFWFLLFFKHSSYLIANWSLVSQPKLASYTIYPQFKITLSGAKSNLKQLFSDDLER